MEGAVAEAADAAAATAAASTSLCVEKAKIKRSESTSESPMIYLVNVEKVSSLFLTTLCKENYQKFKLTLTRDITPVFLQQTNPVYMYIVF
jgi:hypothetical protein